jgi:dihydroorotate dehydrogenase/Pyruvate/2-oxoacid:ferredoxin oxidoreductase delta subunit
VAPVDLSTSFMGMALAHPFMLASAPPAGSAQLIAQAARAGWAGAVTKTVTGSPSYLQNLSPSMLGARARGWRALGMLNNELVTASSLFQWCESEIPAARAAVGAEFCLGVSIMEGPEEQQWARTAALVSSAGASFLELNVSCPHGQPQKFRGTFVGDDPDLLSRVVGAACSASSVPVAVKLNATSAALADAARAALAAGAGGLVTTNTVAALPPVDHLLECGEPARVTVMGLSGPAILPINRLATATLARLGGEVVAVGGVASAADALDYLLLGAAAVQVATVAMHRGLQLVVRLRRDLEQRMEQAGRPLLRELVGTGLDRLTQPQLEQTAPSRVARVDMERCTLCRVCLDPCAVAGADCLSMTADQLIVDQDRCTGCGLCLAVCPRDALELTPENLD